LMISYHNFVYIFLFPIHAISPAHLILIDS
jgi:hypothetical protein